MARIQVRGIFLSSLDDTVDTWKIMAMQVVYQSKLDADMHTDCLIQFTIEGSKVCCSYNDTLPWA